MLVRRQIGAKLALILPFSILKVQRPKIILNFTLAIDVAANHIQNLAHGHGTMLGDRWCLAVGGVGTSLESVPDFLLKVKVNRLVVEGSGLCKVERITATYHVDLVVVQRCCMLTKLAHAQQENRNATTYPIAHRRLRMFGRHKVHVEELSLDVLCSL